MQENYVMPGHSHQLLKAAYIKFYWESAVKACGNLKTLFMFFFITATATDHKNQFNASEKNKYTSEQKNKPESFMAQ